MTPPKRTAPADSVSTLVRTTADVAESLTKALEFLVEQAPDYANDLRAVRNVSQKLTAHAAQLGRIGRPTR